MTEDKVEMPDLGVIPKVGLKANFWNYIQRVTGQRSLKKYIGQGFIFTLLSGFPTIVGAVMRGRAYKTVLGGVGSSCLIEEGVRFYVPQKIFLGDRVFIGRNTYVDANYIESEIRLEDDVFIGRYCMLRAGVGSIHIGPKVTIGSFCFLRGSGGLKIGENSMLSQGVQIITANHVFRDRSMPIKFQGTRYGKVNIGEDVWVGTSTIILADVSIGNGSVIGAGSIVTKDVPKYSLALGAPARVMSKR